LSASTSPDATACAFVVSRATVMVTGSVEAFDTVTLTPGSRSANAFVALVTVCAAAVPAQSVTEASAARVTTAAPGSASTSVAVTSAAVPRCRAKPFAAPVAVLVSCSRYSFVPEASVPAATFVAVTPAAEPLIAVTVSSSDPDAGVTVVLVPSGFVKVSGDAVSPQDDVAAVTPTCAAAV
jgi:hypothetical protein